VSINQASSMRSEGEITFRQHLYRGKFQLCALAMLYQTIIITLSFVVVLVKSECNLPLELKDEIASYAVAVETIINAATSGSFKGVTYNELATFIDKFGPRKVGSDNLENAIDYMLDLSTSNDLENVHGEEVEVPVWERYHRHYFFLLMISWL
jgi:hypothetical protein